VKKAEDAVENAKDPIDRLKALAVLERSRAIDDSAYKFDFIKLAKTWADEEGVPVSAFRSMSVPADVLAAAGLDGKPKERRRTKAGTAPRGAAPRSRRPGVKAEALEEAILGMSEPFTIKEVVDKVGGSPITVKAVLDRLEAQDKVSAAGERPNMRGRASKLWKVG